MRFPHPDFDEICLFAHEPGILIKALGTYSNEDEHRLIRAYCDQKLPPVTSVEALSVMTGFNPGFIWSILTRTSRHYRTFEIPKGNGAPPRVINAPKVGLKAIQSWLSIQWVKKFVHHPNSFGFTPGRSHVDAAKSHVGAEWVISVDIENFFPSIQEARVRDALHDLGYQENSGSLMLSKLLCFNGALTQGSPASPVISNVVLRKLDEKLTALAEVTGAVYTRYADDIVFSGQGLPPTLLSEALLTEITDDGWRVAENKSTVSILPERLKVHGLLVHGSSVRLTKGYRNKIRAYRHLLKSGKISEKDLKSVHGHVAYAAYVEKSAAS
ncbi:reverse transcriptase family protein [Sulfitobacter sp. R86518]|uniref:reverse transcriptase family protein n=1 Tax=Sulfitobacter sp. R86518 TaxID=3093858 RepID=UPI0036DDFB46